MSGEIDLRMMIMMMMMMMHGDLSFQRMRAAGPRLLSRDLYWHGVGTYKIMLKELFLKWLQLEDFKTMKMTMSRTHILSLSRSQDTSQ